VFLPKSIRFIVLVAVLGVLVRPAHAATAEPANQPVAELSVRDAVVLGLVEGITEFLPVSSTGHLIIANHFLGLDSEKPLADAAGQPLWYKKPSATKPGVPLTVKLAADTYSVIIQVGAIMAVVFLYWSQLANIALGLIGRSSSGFRLLRNIVFAVLPAVIIGLPLHEWIEEHLFSLGTVIAAQILGGLLMLWAERWRRANSGVGASRNDPADLSPGKATGIGLAQCLALCPGTSRSMVTIVGGYLTGLSPVKAAEFSFLVGLPTLAGAALLKAVKTGPAMIEVFGWGNMLLGILIATISAAIAVKFLVKFLTRHGLGVFAYYRFAMALALLFLFMV
jgi:undecaprenyl-diphosphatase